MPAATKPRDLTIDNWHGTRTDTNRYGYAPNGNRESWVILCTVPGARGPFTRRRTVTVGPWELDPTDNPSACPRCLTPVIDGTRHIAITDPAVAEPGAAACEVIR